MHFMMTPFSMMPTLTPSASLARQGQEAHMAHVAHGAGGADLATLGNVSKATLAQQATHAKHVKEEGEEKKEENKNGSIERDPLLNRLLSSVLTKEKDDSKIEFLQGSTLNVVGHFSEGFTLAVMIKGLLHYTKIRQAEEDGKLVPGQILAGRGEDGHFYRVRYQKNGVGSKNDFWKQAGQNPTGESVSILRSKRNGFFGFLTAYEPVARLLDPNNTRYNSPFLDVQFLDEPSTRYRASVLGTQAQATITADNIVDRRGYPSGYAFDVIEHKPSKEMRYYRKAFTEELEHDLGSRIAEDLWKLPVVRQLGRYGKGSEGRPRVKQNTQPWGWLPSWAKDKSSNLRAIRQTKPLNRAKQGSLSMEDLPIPFDPHAVLSLKKKDTLSKFLKYVPPLDHLVGWGVIGGLCAAVFGTWVEASHANISLPTINFGGGGGAPAPAEGASSHGG